MITDSIASILSSVWIKLEDKIQSIYMKRMIVAFNVCLFHQRELEKNISTRMNGESHFMLNWTEKFCAQNTSEKKLNESKSAVMCKTRKFQVCFEAFCQGVGQIRDHLKHEALF